MTPSLGILEAADGPVDRVAAKESTHDAVVAGGAYRSVSARSTNTV
jgi:hypothetical protein